MGRHVVITGAARGTGAALALAFAKRGDSLILGARSLDALTPVVEQARALGAADVRGLALDLADAASVTAFAAAVAQSGPGVDVLVNNGCQFQSGALTALDADSLAGPVDTGVVGTLRLTRGLLPTLMAGPGGDVVTIVSISGIPHVRMHDVSLPFYMAKHGQHALVEGLRQELRGTPVRSIGIYPPYLDDAMPGTAAWEAAGTRPKQAWATTRQVVDAVLFALDQPRNVSLSITIDADEGSIYSPRVGVGGAGG